MRRYASSVTFTCLAAGTMLLHFAVAEPQALAEKAPQDAVKDQEAAWQRLRSMVGAWDGTGESAASRAEMLDRRTGFDS